MMVKACEGGHIGVVKHLIKLGITDVEGPDGLNGLAIALGQLDSDLVSILGDPEVQPKAPEFLCDIFEELNREISGEKSESNKIKLECMKTVIEQHMLHGKFCEKSSCCTMTWPSSDQK